MPEPSKDINELDNCPQCGSSWIGEEIPEENREDYGGRTHFRRVIGVEYWYGSPERYDGISEYRCPDCKTRWGRWTGQVIPPGYCESRWGERGVVEIEDITEREEP